MQKMLWRGRFHSKKKMFMGSVPSCEIGTRLSGTIIFIVNPPFNYECPAISRVLPPDFLSIIRGWKSSRAAVYGKIIDQLRPFNFAFVQYY